MKALILFVCLLAGNSCIACPQADSIPSIANTTSKLIAEPHRLAAQRLILPAALLGYGIASLSNHSINDLNRSTRKEIAEHQPATTRLDNYTQYVPAALVYSLNSLGIKSSHNFRDRTILLAGSQLIVAGIVVPAKSLLHVERPDGSNFHSFPSGHTATAFSTAQFMYREYRHSNKLLSLAGYPFAVFTGVYRTLNNKHWVGDVAAGAGIGILSTELAYWAFPYFSKLAGGRNWKDHLSVAPYTTGTSWGIGLVKQW